MWLITILAFFVGISLCNCTALLDSTTCGYQNTNDGILEGVVDLYEFPWMVYIKFTNLEYEYEFADRCSGVLINDRYVLTDANCGVEAIKVVLGQYKTNESVSCQDSICTNPKIEIMVEEQIRNGRIQNGRYDFTLLRLTDKVVFSDFIKPICLNFNETEIKHDFLTISGWGASNSSGIAKKNLNYEVVSDAVCYEKEGFLENNVKFANVSFICATPLKSNIESACNGEHGGPFMYKSMSNQWFAEGVVVQVMYSGSSASVFNSCTKDDPINGIKITSDTLEWILASIRP
ncbi:hypothetical protein FQA39_LY15865 [Lamprigera yunnana]|nr:hypothetical protein FQA39_LY15865 [Lamprigera yunnana]